MVKDNPEEVILANDILKLLLEIVHDIKSTKDKVLEAHPNLEISIIIWQGIMKMFTPYYKLYSEKKASTAQTNLDKFLPETKYFLNISNVLNYSVLNKC